MWVRVTAQTGPLLCESITGGGGDGGGGGEFSQCIHSEPAEPAGRMAETPGAV